MWDQNFGFREDNRIDPYHAALISAIWYYIDLSRTTRELLDTVHLRHHLGCMGRNNNIALYLKKKQKQVLTNLMMLR